MEFSASYIRSILHYDPETGVFTWKWRDDLRARDNRRNAGKIAGCFMPDGYTCIGINRKYFKAHRLAWFYVYGEWPSSQIDHVNGKKSDNRIKNLREATAAQNKWNTGVSSTNTSGAKGVSFYKQTNRWKASICANGRKIHLGYFLDFKEAQRAYQSAVTKHFGQFAKTA